MFKEKNDDKERVFLSEKAKSLTLHTQHQQTYMYMLYEGGAEELLD